MFAKVDVKKLLEGDENEFSQFVNLNLSKIRRIVYFNTYNKALCDDIVQEVLYQLYKSLSTYRGKAEFSTWVYGLTRNIVRQHNRSNQRISNNEVYLDDIVYAQRGSGAEPEDALLVKEDFESVIQLVRQLPMRHQQVLYLIDFKGLSYEEAARRLHCPVGTVKSRLFYARERLKKSRNTPPCLQAAGK